MARKKLADTVDETQVRRLGELLVAQKLVTQDEVKKALLDQESSGQRLGAALVARGALDERDLARVLAAQLEIPMTDLRRTRPEDAALGKLPDTVARSFTAIPLQIIDGTLVVAAADPSDELRAEIARAAGMPVELHIAAASDIRRTIDKSYRALADVDAQVAAFQATIAARVSLQPGALQAAVTSDAPVVQIVNLIITQALRDRASDIHVEPQADRVRVRFRIDGALHDVVALPVDMAQAVISRIKIMAEMNIVERQRSQDGQIAMQIEEKGIDIRVATTATIWGEKAVLRLLDKSRSLLRLDELGMKKETHHAYAEAIRAPFGMVVCAGPTGTGKTTTLYATLNEINNPERNIMTVEDPVEYIFPDINQIQIKEQAGISFAQALRSILRQDPDMILIGEIRDVETARIAVQSALTGHFVMSSIHATDAASALHRFLDMGIEPFLIASSLLAVVGQRLIRLICPECKERYGPGTEELTFWARAEDSGEVSHKKSFIHGSGCNFCAGTGYSGRTGIYELLRIDESMKQMIVSKEPVDEIRDFAVKERGMSSLRQEALRLVEEDRTTISEVLRAIYVM